jgi:hypothetical protein
LPKCAQTKIENASFWRDNWFQGRQVVALQHELNNKVQNDDSMWLDPQTNQSLPLTTCLNASLFMILLKNQNIFIFCLLCYSYSYFDNHGIRKFYSAQLCWPHGNAIPGNKRKHRTFNKRLRRTCLAIAHFSWRTSIAGI